jgi:hypothetical protein
MKIFTGLVIVMLVSLLLVGCGKEVEEKEEIELPPFPDSNVPDEGGDAMEEIVIEEPELLAEDEVDIGDVI